MVATLDLHSPTVAGHPRAADPPEDHLAPELSLFGEAFAGLDWLGLRLSPVYEGRGVPPGDGSGVVLIPGMFARNDTMVEMWRWLRRIGYMPYFTGMRRNDDCPERSLELVSAAVTAAHAETGKRVHIVGHSLGGLLARGAAMMHPEMIASVTTLGTPVRGVRVHPLVARSAMYMRGGCDGTCVAGLQRVISPSVRETSIYSRSDGIVSWRNCRCDEIPSVEVRSTHTGMVVSAGVYRALADALAGSHAAPKRAPTPQPIRRTVRTLERQPLAA
jgi:pimeloyl-ACP methyl ester carboxylesterase